MSGGLRRELTRNQRSEEVEATVRALAEEVVRHRSSIQNIETFLETWPVKVDETQVKVNETLAKAVLQIYKAETYIMWMQLPWWRRAWMRTRAWWEGRKGVGRWQP